MPIINAVGKNYYTVATYSRPSACMNGFLSIVCLLTYQKLKLCFSELPLDYRPLNSFSITLNNNVIKRVFHFTYIGIVFDDRLSWNEHIKHLILKAGKRVGMLGRLRRSLTRESAKCVGLLRRRSQTRP